MSSEPSTPSGQRPPRDPRPPGTLVLVGLMGAGKSAVGRRLARRLGLPFRDADKEIEIAAGLAIAEIFDLYGEASFRDCERRVIARLLDGPPHVLATGGGAFMDPQIRSLVKSKAVSIWLKADLDVLVERTGRRNTRPLLRQGDPREILSGLMDVRYPVYAEADITVPTNHGPIDTTVDTVMASLNGWAAPP